VKADDGIPDEELPTKVPGPIAESICENKSRFKSTCS
jgi:hypothetical protein